MSESDLKSQLDSLGALGVMHITPFQPAEDESINKVNAQINYLEEAIDILEKHVPTSDAESLKDAYVLLTETITDQVALAEQVHHYEDTLTQKRAYSQLLEQAKQWFINWGNISINELVALKESGIYLRLYLLNDDALKKLSDRNDIFLVGKIDQMNQVVLISENSNEKLDFEEIPVPPFSFNRVDKIIDETNQEIQAAVNELQILYSHSDILKNELNELLRSNTIRTVKFSGLDVENKFRYWNGYIPEQSIQNFANVAQEQNWGYLIQDPTQEELDEVPTLISSSKWVEWIKPVMNFMGLVPGYNEIDVSRIFMIFFTFFTGILVGDAGYGAVFLLLTLLVHSRQKFKPQIEFSLIYTLSGSVMFWGVLTGTYFGAKEIAEIPFLSNFIVDKMATFGGDVIFIQKFIFILGAIHLSIGHIQTAIKYINSVKAIAQLGWVAIVWGLYLLVAQMVLKEPTPDFMIWLFGGGAALVALFSNPGPNFFKGILTSLASLPLSLISGFSDVISYIRLYAVGLATVLMAVSFNEMAIGEGITTVFSGIAAVLILILGHGLNMILAAMAVIVHGVRLNMLEYAGHASVEFSGNEYQPFKLKNKKNNKQIIK